MTEGTSPVEASFTTLGGHSYLIEVTERDNDAYVEVLDSTDSVIAHADHPERRTGTRRATVVTSQQGPIRIRVTGKEHVGLTGTAAIRVFDLASAVRPECLAVFNNLAAADSSYGTGQSISTGHASATGSSARDAYLRAAESYAAAERELEATGDQQLRGETQLALAGLYLRDLPDWSNAADRASAAAALLQASDPYRAARADAIRADAWLQISQSESVEQGAGLLSRTRELLQRLTRFHLRRGEQYDAALQVQNTAVSYLFQGRYAECVRVSAEAGRRFASIHEAVREAQSWQSRSLCLWGLGQLSAARDGFGRALALLGPAPPPPTYLAIVTNTALLEYALGHYDESLRIYDQALVVAQSTQRELDVARCRYGIGVNYRALGDLEKARDLLERSLMIRTVSLDGRGRMQSLRALAIVDATEGKLDEAIRYDREALPLATDPLASESIRVQLAGHLAAAGDFDDARPLINEVLEKGPRGDPLILADALVQRAIILRGTGQSSAARADLLTAIQRFHAFSRATQEFAATLELARTLRQMGDTAGALAAVGRALTLGDAVRVQSVNPDFRVQLQAPLRAAYELEIELLRAQYDTALTLGHPGQAAALATRAFAAADSSRARTFADVAAQKYSPALRRELAPELHRREELYHEIAERRFALDALTDPTPTRNPRARYLLSEISELQRRTDTVNTAIAKRVARPGGPAASRRALIPLIPSDAVLVSYWLGTESSYAWVISRAQVHWVRLAPRSEIAARAKDYHDSLGRFIDQSTEQRLAEGVRLSKLVLAPIEPWLSDIRQWLVVPDGVLDYIPFAALEESPEPGSFVVLQHDVALLPAAWMLGSSDSGKAETKRGLLVVDDPVYQADDPRLAAAQKMPTTSGQRGPSDHEGYQRLPYTAQEAAAIEREFAPPEVDELTGLDATRERFLSSDLSQYRYIHIATHGRVDTLVPELSALIFSLYDRSGTAVEGAVRVPDLALQTLHAEVAVFSACDTALGREGASEGLVGIGSTVLARGAKAVVASLWPVSDEIGAKLMTEFYRHLLRDSMSAPAALAAAMRSVVSRERAADPALWAAYQVSVVALGPGRPSRNDVNYNSTTTKKGGSL